jgi:hypothetical protein
MAVSTMAWGSGSLISCCGVVPMIGAPPAAPLATRKSTLTPLDASSTPTRIRVSERSSIR